MASGNDSRARDALLRLLADASSSPEARVDALVALSQRTVWVPTWEPISTAYRTLEQEDGRTALPVFTDEWELDHAAVELDWNRHGARVGRVEVGAREAFRKVLDDKLDCLVVDLAARHAMEALRAEIEPLAKARTRSDSQGAFAAVGKISTTVLEAVRASQTAAPPASPLLGRVSSHPPPETAFSVQPAVPIPTRTPVPPPPGPQRIRTPFPQPAAPLAPRTPVPPPMPSRVATLPPPLPQIRKSEVPMIGDSTHIRATATIPPPPPLAAPEAAGVPVSDATAKLFPVQQEPLDAMLDALIAVMRNFPEVEWAAYGMVSVGELTARPMIVLRVDAAYRQRVAEIATSVARTASGFGPTLDTLIVDRADIIKAARLECVTFFPWKRRKTGGTPPIAP